MYVPPTPQLNQELLVASCRPDESIPHSHKCNHIVRQRLGGAHPVWRVAGAPRRSAPSRAADHAAMTEPLLTTSEDVSFKADVGAIYARLCTQISAARPPPRERRALFSVVLTSIKEESHGTRLRLYLHLRATAAWAERG